MPKTLKTFRKYQEWTKYQEYNSMNTHVPKNLLS